MDGESVMRCYISTDIALTACLRQRLTLLGLQITISSSRKRPSRDRTDRVNRTEPGSCLAPFSYRNADYSLLSMPLRMFPDHR